MPSGHLLTAKTGTWTAAMAERHAEDGLFHCGNAPSCGSAAVFDSILVQQTGMRKCDYVPLSHALQRSIPVIENMLNNNSGCRPLTDRHRRY